jgi:uncharacterized protein (TIGR02271 family)
MSETERPEASIPLAQERVTVEKRRVETGRVRIRSVVDEKLVRVAEDLEQDDVRIEHVPINREVTEPPRTREEDGVLIVPIFEEVVIVEKRLMLKEELHIHRNHKRERVESAVRLKTMHVEVERAAVPVATESGPGEAVRPVAKLRRKERLTDRRK